MTEKTSLLVIHVDGLNFLFCEAKRHVENGQNKSNFASKHDKYQSVIGFIAYSLTSGARFRKKVTVSYLWYLTDVSGYFKPH